MPEGLRQRGRSNARSWAVGGFFLAWLVLGPISIGGSEKDIFLVYGCYVGRCVLIRPQ